MSSALNFRCEICQSFIPYEKLDEGKNEFLCSNICKEAFKHMILNTPISELAQSFRKMTKKKIKSKKIILPAPPLLERQKAANHTI